MNNIEQKFIKSFIVKNKQNRLLFEFSKHSRRFSAIDRFSHNSISLLKVIPSSTFSRFEKEKLAHFMNLSSGKNECYIISFETFLDKRFFLLDEALLYAEKYFPLILIFQNGNAVVFEERTLGKQNIIFLNQNN